nr:reverse transcriptase domain-containing protein [Tanacetum cinerariifolium]
MHQEKLQQEKLKVVKARLNFEEVSQPSELGTPSRRRDHRKRIESKRIRNTSESPELRRDRSELPRKRGPKREMVFKRLEKDVFHRLGDKEKTKVKRWAMPTWCHMFNSTLTESARVWFDDLPLESIDSYDNLKKAFLANYLQQKKCIKDPVEIHHIKQREGESTVDFMQRFKFESRRIKGSPECMIISRFMHEITNLELIKRLHDNIPMLVDEMMRATTSSLRKELGASNQARKKMLSVWKQHHHAPNRVQWRNHMAIGANITTGEDWRRGTFNLGLDELYDRGILTLKSSKIILIECAAVTTPEGQPPTVNQVVEERIKEGCPPVMPKRRGQAKDRNHAIQEEVKKLVDTAIMKEVYYYS